jgi:hypothetical protein
LLLMPLAIPALFVLQVSPTVDQADAQELGPKQAYLSGPRPAETPRGAATPAATNSPAKPAGKMGFVPASPAPRKTPAGRPQVVNPQARRSANQPPKYAVSAGGSLEAPTTPSPANRATVARPAKPRPSAVAGQPSAPAAVPAPVEAPEPPANVAAPPTAIAETQPQTPRTLELPEEDLVPPEPEMEERPARGVVQLFFDDEPADGDSEEMLDLGEPEAPAVQSRNIQQVAGQDTAAPAGRAQDVEGADKSADEKRKFMTEILADLKPVRQVKLSDAVRLPKLGEKEDEKVREPEDLAFAMLHQRKPLNFLPIARDPWMADRDSYPFLHKPLWFEDPNLERCGRGYGHFTTAASVVHFSANIPLLPYRMASESQCRCVPTLPDCTVCEKFGCEAYLPPWSWRAAAVQAAATVGFIYVIP